MAANGNVGIGTAAPGGRLDVNGGALRLSNSYLDINRAGFSNSGISWYSQSYPSWSTYMSPAGATSTGPHADLTAPSGSFVTSWALRNYIENIAGYGWTFESAANTTTPAVKFEIRASDGLFHSYGNGIIDGNVGIGTAAPLLKLKVVGDIESNNMIRATGWLIGTGAGQGSEIGVSSGYSYFFGYDRTAAVYTPTRLVGSTIDLRHSDASSDLFITTAGNTGLGTTTPGAKLEVAGQVKITGGTPGAGKVLTSDATGLATWVTPGAGTVTSVTGTAPIVSSGGTTPAISITQSGTAANGYLSSTDWNTFNNKAGGSGTLNYIPKWTPNGTTLGNSQIFDNGTNVGIGTAAPAYKLEVYGATASYPAKVGGPDGYLIFGPANTSWSHFVTDRPRFYFNTGGTFDTGNIGSYDEDLSLQTSGTTRISVLNSNGNVGIGTTAPVGKLHIAGVHTNGVIADGNDRPGVGATGHYPQMVLMAGGSANASHGSTLMLGSYDAGTSGAHKHWSIGTAGNGSTFLDIGYSSTDINPHAGIRNYAGSTFMTILNTGNVGIGTIAPAFKLHVPSGYIGTDYINTTDNAVASGVTGIMVKQGDNYLRTSNAAGVLTFLGITAPTGDNLGNHTATTTLNMNANTITNIGEAYNNGWFRNNNSGIGLYNQATGNHFYSDGAYWNIGMAGGSTGIRLRNAYAGALYGYFYADGSGIGVLHGAGGWAILAGGAVNTANTYLDFRTNSAQRMYIDGAGNVGIGTVSPTAKLHVSSGDGSLALFGPNATWGGKLYVGASTTQVAAGISQVISTNGNLHLDAGTGQNIYLGNYTASNTFINPSGGNVGIGTTSPTFKLHVPSGYIGTDYINTSDNSIASGVTGVMVKAGDNYHRTATAAALATFLNTTGTWIPNNGNGDWQIASSSTGTSYSVASLELRESNFTGNGTATPPRLGFHWGGVVASQIAIESNGRIAIRDNPGTGYENFIAKDITGTILYDQNDASYYVDPNATSQLYAVTNYTRAAFNLARLYTNRRNITSDQNYWTGSNGWGTGECTWDDAWKFGYSGLDIWGTSSGHPQGAGYVHAQGIQSGMHYASADGSSAYGWQMVGAADATANRYWLRGKWGGSTSGWVEMITTGNIGSYSGFDNLGNHTATTTLNLNNNNISNIGDIYATKDYGLGLVGVYSSTNYQNVFSMGTSWRLAANGTTPGNLYGLAWTHTNVGGQSKAGLSHQLLIMENGVTKVALGSGIWTNYTSYLPFMYDTDNTGYYFDANSSSQVSAIYANNWFRAQGSCGLYFQDYGGGWHMSDGTWIRSYGGKNVYVDAQLRADGGIVSGGLGSLGGGTINANGNIVNSAPSQGTLALTGDLPGYGVNTYPTVKTSYSYMFFSMANYYSAYMDASGYLYAVSSRTKKDNFEVLDKQDILKKISELEMYKWNSKRGDARVKHIGPIAEDFWDKFHLGDNDSMISHVDPAGVALAGVQALNENYKSQQVQIETIQSNLSDFGSVNVITKELWINFNPSFSSSIDKDQLPIVTVTSNQPGISMYVAEKNNSGFKLVINSNLSKGLNVDYIAMAHAKKIAPESVKQSAKSTDGIKVEAHHNQDMQKFADPTKIDYKAQAAEFNVQKQIAEKVGIKNEETKGQTEPPKPINPKVIEPKFGPKLAEQPAPPSEYPTVPVSMPVPMSAPIPVPVPAPVPSNQINQK
ncbi:MAG: tail fiber domain-containing protein [Bacteroidota bacterium]